MQIGDDITGAMIVRVVQNDQGSILPPDIIGGAPKHASRARLGELLTLIDMDHYICVPVPESAGPLGPNDLSDVLKLPVFEQIQELQTALSLNKSQLAQILRVSRPTLYEWLRDKEPNPANNARLHAIFRCLAQTRVSSASPLNARFVRRSAELGTPSLLELLSKSRIEEGAIVKAIREVQALEHEAIQGRTDREERLRKLGFEDQNQNQRREQLATSAALRRWPNP